MSQSDILLVTGCAGFIGSSTAYKLLDIGFTVIGIDNFYPSYPKKFKQENLKILEKFPKFYFYKTDILHKKKVTDIFKKYSPCIVLHLAALTGVRASIKQSQLYNKVNVKGTKTVYELAVKAGVKKFIFSSSSSVYGNSKHTPFHELQKPAPQSPYAKSKVEAEKLLHQLSLQYKLPTTILRLFSVYGPKGRPDMAPYIFTQAAFMQKQVSQFGSGDSIRDYTYIDDAVSAIILTIYKKLHGEIINIGSSYPIKLSYLIQIIEATTKMHLRKKILPLIKQEAFITHADISKAKKLLHWQPQTNFETGMRNFIRWFRKYRLESKSL